MGITDELREWAEDNTLQDTVLTTYPPQHAVHGVLETLLRIADRIDAEHQKGIHELNGLAEACVLLPKDANGEAIRAGDRLDGYGKTITVVEMRHGRSGWVLISEYGNAYADNYAFTHHHAPTVEDVMVEFATDWEHAQDGEDKTAVLKEYAAKLRLAGDTE